LGEGSGHFRTRDAVQIDDETFMVSLIGKTVVLNVLNLVKHSRDVVGFNAHLIG
jgi:hypothetical protein